MARYERQKVGEIHRVRKVKTFSDHVKDAFNVVVGILIFVIIIAAIAG